MQQVNLGMIGGGTVGSGVFHAWQKNGGLMGARLGVKLVFRKIAVKAFDEPRPYPITRELMTTDWQGGRSEESDVCSSDLRRPQGRAPRREARFPQNRGKGF